MPKKNPDILRRKNEWSDAAPQLAAMQSEFMDAVLKGAPEILASIPANSRTTNAVLLGVYQSAYASRLVGILESDHPYLKTCLGDDAFRDMAHEFIRAHPSRTPNARWFGQGLPEFLAEVEPYRMRKELAEIAQITRALNDAFDAEDGEPIGLESLASVPPETWGSLVFSPHASVRRLRLSTNAFEIWLRLKASEIPPSGVPLPLAQQLIAWRADSGPKIREMSSEEAMMWDEAARGAPFGALCELVAHFGESDTAALRAAQHLQGWLTSDMLGAFSMSRAMSVVAQT